MAIKSKYTTFKGKDGWRWRCRSGRTITAVSGEAFASKFNAQRALVQHVTAHFHCGYTIDHEKSLPDDLRKKLALARKVTHWWSDFFA